MDMVATYAASKGWVLAPHLVLVEGTSDEELVRLTDRLASQSGYSLLGQEVSVLAAGLRDRGGTFGVARELITLRSMAPFVLDAGGGQAYQVMGLVDNDHAGRRIIEDVLRMDRSAAEFRDIAALKPVPPTFSSPDPDLRRSECDRGNLPYRSLDWEIEDALSPRLIQLFEQQHPGMVLRRIHQSGKYHHEISREGKTALHRLVRREANLGDLLGIVQIVGMVRSMFGLRNDRLPPCP